MNVFKKLAGQTVIYGSSSIIGRFLNFLLTPLYAIQFTNEQYGIITEMYAYVAFLVVLLTYGMETSYFRFSSQKENASKNVFSNTLYSLFTTSGFFVLLIIIFSQEIANWLKYPNHSEYIIWFGLIVGLDAISSIPLAKLRSEYRAKKFAIVNLINVAVNIGLNLFFILYCKTNYDLYIDNHPENIHWLVMQLYNPEIGVGYVFISNLISSIIKFLLLVPEMDLKGHFDWKFLKSMLSYSYPMLFVGLAYVINETLDRAMLKSMLFEHYMQEGSSYNEALKEAQVQNGIYGANYKITMVVTMFIQAFRYASEPFFFNNESQKNSKEILAKVMNYFIIILVLVFLIITLYLHVFKYFIPNPEYWEGLQVVPILLGANIFLGIYTTLSMWYKLTEKTKYGAYISGFGALITLSINFTFITMFEESGYHGYLASAIATLICYGSMMILSYFLGQKFYPIPYKMTKFFIYIGAGCLLYFISLPFDPIGSYDWRGYAYHTILVLSYVLLVYFLERKEKKMVLS